PCRHLRPLPTRPPSPYTPLFRSKSGTADFLSRLSGDQQKDAQLIGQFGVGFYSSFIVAEDVEVFSRKAGTPAEAGVHWRSRGDGDRKSTRLNSSHVKISYAVFCW